MLEPFSPSVRIQNKDTEQDRSVNRNAVYEAVSLRLLTRSRLTSAARADLVGQAVVVPHGPAGRIAPPILACGLFRVTRIEDTVLGLARLADHEQTYFACAVVEEAVAE